MPEYTVNLTINTLYTADEALTSDRTVTGADKKLTLNGVKQFNVIAADPGVTNPSIYLQGFGTTDAHINMRLANGAGNTIFENYGNRMTRYYGPVAIGDAPLASQMFRSYTADGSVTAATFQNDGANGTAFNSFATGSGGRGGFFNATGSNSTGVQAIGTVVGMDGITSSANSISTRGLFVSDSALGGIAVVGSPINTSNLRSDLNHAGMFSGNVLHFGYSKSSLPSIANKALHYGTILVIDAGVGNNEYAICVYDNTNWIDIRNQLPVL